MRTTKVGDIIKIRQPIDVRALATPWKGELGMIVRRLSSSELMGQVGRPYDAWFEVMLFESGDLKVFREEYLQFVKSGKNA